MLNEKTKSLRFLACLSAFSFSGAQGMMIALYPVLAWALNLNLPTLIACFSFGSLLFLVGSPFWSSRSDVLGRQKVMTVGTGALLISFALIVFLVQNSFSNTFFTVTILIASRTIYGLVASATVPAAQSLQADLAGESQATRAMMIHSMSISLGRVVGLALIVLFHEQFKKVLLVYLILLMGVFFINFLHPSKAPVRTKQLPPFVSWKVEAFHIRWVIVIAFLFTCFMEALYSSLTGTIKNLFQLDNLVASGISANVLLVMSVGIFLVQSVGKTFAKESSKMGLLVGALALVLGSIFLTKINSLFDLWAAVGFFVIGIGLIPPFYLSLLRTEGSSAQYGKRAGIIASSHTLGYASGGAISALIFKIGNIPIGFVLLFLGIGLGLVSLKQSKIMSRRIRV